VVVGYTWRWRRPAQAEGIVVEYEAGEGQHAGGKRAYRPLAGCGKGKRGNKKQKKKSNQPRVRAALAPRGVRLIGQELSWANSGRMQHTVLGRSTSSALFDDHPPSLEMFLVDLPRSINGWLGFGFIIRRDE
jgi:hypothetical protein